MLGGRLVVAACAALLAACAAKGPPAPATAATKSAVEPSKVAPGPQPAAPAPPAPKPEPPQPTPAIEKQVAAHLDKMRAIKPARDAKEAQLYNKVLEDAWKYFIARPESIHVLRRTLARELTQKARSDFLLLDLGYFLYERGTARDKDLAKSALYALEPGAEVIRFNQQELFQFTQGVARDRDARILAFIDKAFLRPQVAVRIPEANLTLDPVATCAILYGAYGDGAEAHLAALLKTPVKDKPFTRKVLDVLAWIGTPGSNGAVKNVLMGASRDSETFMRTTNFLMSAGGPQGRAVVMAVQPSGLDVWTANYFEKIQPRVRTTSFSALRSQLGDNAANREILDSSRPRGELMDRLSAERTRLFGMAPTKERLAEIQRVGSLINALRYRDT